MLATKSECKYIGFTLYNCLNMSRTQGLRARGLMAAMSDVVRLGKELGLPRSPWAMARLFQTCNDVGEESSQTEAQTAAKLRAGEWKCGWKQRSASPHGPQRMSRTCKHTCCSTYSGFDTQHR